MARKKGKADQSNGVEKEMDQHQPVERDRGTGREHEPQIVPVGPRFLGLRGLCAAIPKAQLNWQTWRETELGMTMETRTAGAGWGWLEECSVDRAGTQHEAGCRAYCCRFLDRLE